MKPCGDSANNYMTVCEICCSDDSVNVDEFVEQNRPVEHDCYRGRETTDDGPTAEY
uniref:Uncharacterized protein n=1 Tax=Caenorhabditis japonica TaxID=281687 RepID=A0A8R1ITD0_CAEJA